MVPPVKERVYSPVVGSKVHVWEGRIDDSQLKPLSAGVSVVVSVRPVQSEPVRLVKAKQPAAS